MTRLRLIALLLVLVGFAALAGLVLQPAPGAPLHPQGRGPEGGGALARLLEREGVTVDEVDGVGSLEAAASDPDGRTLLLAGTAYLNPEVGERLLAAAEGADRLVVVVQPGADLRGSLGLDVDTPSGSGLPVDPVCDSPLAREGDRLTTWETQLSVEGAARDGAVVCYPPTASHNVGGARDGALVILPADGTRPETVLVGVGKALTNAHLAEGANAALGLRLLGASQHLAWVQPSPNDTLQEPAGLWDVLPRNLTAWVVLLGAAVTALAVVCGRRLGRVVHEPLPAVVHATETARSRGRLYAQAHDRTHTLAALQAGTRGRLAPRLGLPDRPDDAEALVRAVADATERPVDEVRGLLTDPSADDDTTLVRRTGALRELERQVRSVGSGA